jgi:hypothetical protein
VQGRSREEEISYLRETELISEERQDTHHLHRWATCPTRILAPHSGSPIRAPRSVLWQAVSGPCGSPGGTKPCATLVATALSLAADYQYDLISRYVVGSGDPLPVRTAAQPLFPGFSHQISTPDTFQVSRPNSAAFRAVEHARSSCAQPSIGMRSSGLTLHEDPARPGIVACIRLTDPRGTQR